jgi:hypothetical protein
MSSDELFERLMVGGGLRRDVEGQQRVFWGLWLRPLQWRAGRRRRRAPDEAAARGRCERCGAALSGYLFNVLRRLGGFIRKPF